MDKKSCENCIKTHCKLTDDDRRCGNITGCVKGWQRNPRKWLSILPMESGWYWWRGNRKGEPEIARVCKCGIFFTGSEYLQLAQVLGGEWQGPIEPYN